MPKIIKYLAIALAGLIGLFAIVAGIIAATFNPNDYKPLIIKLVQEKKQRTLAIPGEIKLTFFPKIGADLGKLSISEHNSAMLFASVNSARVSLALVPLLSKQLVVDKIKIDGLTAHITRYKDGKTNFDDLLSGDKQESQQIKFDIDGISLTNTSVTFDDERGNNKLEVGKLNLNTGPIANGKASKFELSADVKSSNPKLAARVEAKSGFNMDLDQKHFLVTGIDANLKGQVLNFSDLIVTLTGDADLKPSVKQFALDDIKLSLKGKQASQALEVSVALPKLAITNTRVQGGKLAVQAKVSEPGREIDAVLAAPAFEGTPQAFKLPALTANANVKQGELSAQAKLAGAIDGDIDKLLFTSPQLTLNLDGRQGATAIKGVLTTPLRADLKGQVIDLVKIGADFNLPNPGGGALTFRAAGNMSVNLAKQTLAAALTGKLDQSGFDAKLGLAKFSPPAYTFDVNIDQIDVDRYTKKSAAAQPSPTAAPEQPIDLSALKALDASGSLKIGSLKAANLRASNVRLDVHAGAGKVDVNPLAANLYQGSVKGSLSAVAANPPRFVVKQTLANIAVGPLLKDAMNKDPIEGKGNVQLDISAQGATATQLKKGLNGAAKLNLRDGAVKGINIAETIRGAKSAFAGATGKQESSGTSSANAKTDFSELSGSFKIANGVAHNDDLDAKSPLLRVGGNGDINLGADSLDYTVKATVVSTLQGQGGPELQALKGLTVPVHLYGPFTAMGWKVDFAGLADAAAKQKIDEKKQEVKEKAKEQLQDKLKGLLGH
jgi:AsmA protein